MGVNLLFFMSFYKMWKTMWKTILLNVENYLHDLEQSKGLIRAV